MSQSDLIGQTFDGYKLVEVVASGDEEALYVGERVRDGERVWVRTARVDDPAALARLRQRYEAEAKAARQLASVGAVLPVRETIRLGDASGLVTPVPHGRSLNDRFAEQNSPWPLRAVLPWFRKLMTAMEAAHDEGAAHGSLQGRAIYLDDDNRVTICGVAVMDADRLDAAKRDDVKSLASMLYRATTGRPAKSGFPDTGMPPSPENYVPDYPGSLGRFLRRRLSDDEFDDPVSDAGLLRRSIDALEVDPAFRKVVGLAPRADEEGGASEVGHDRAHRRNLWRTLVVQSLIVIGFVALSVTTTLIVMESRVEDARLRAGAEHVRNADVEGAAKYTEPTPRLSVWRCLLSPLAEGPGGLDSALAEACMRLAPEVKREVLLAELSAVSAVLRARPVKDRGEDMARAYEKLFLDGADSIARHASGKLANREPVSGLEEWAIQSPAPQVSAVLQTLSGRSGPTMAWAAGLLERRRAAKREELESLEMVLGPVPDIEGNDRITDAYRSLFSSGPESLDKWLSGRRDSGHSVASIEYWVVADGDARTVSVLRTLAERDGKTGQWAKKLLARASSRSLTP